MHTHIPTLTLDTNLLIEYWKQRNKQNIIKKLLLLARTGKLNLTVTARIREDIPSPSLSEKINELPELNIDESGSVTRLGFWMLGRDMLADQDFADSYSIVHDMMKEQGKTPPDWRDWDHLHAHYLLQHDVFLTWDKGILYLREYLKDNFDVIVMKPEEYLANS